MILFLVLEEEDEREKELRERRWRELALIPQGAMNSLNPVMKVRKQIADAIIRLLDDKEFANKLGMYGEKNVENNNSWPKITETTREFYKSLIL